MLLTADDSQNYVMVIEHLIAQLHKDYYTQQENFIHICRLHKRYSCNTPFSSAPVHEVATLHASSILWGISLSVSCWVLVYPLKQAHLCFWILDAGCQWKLLHSSFAYFVLNMPFLSWISQVFPCQGDSSSSQPHYDDGKNKFWQGLLGNSIPQIKRSQKSLHWKEDSNKGGFFFSFVLQIIFCIGHSTLH